MNPFEEYGVSPELFGAISYKLTATGERVRVTPFGADIGLVGARFHGEVAGIPLTFHNVKDGENGYYWTYSVSGEGWKLRAAISMSPPRDGRPHAKITIQSLGEDRERYVFTPRMEGDLEKMRRDLSLVRLFLD